VFGTETRSSAASTGVAESHLIQKPQQEWHASLGQPCQKGATDGNAELKNASHANLQQWVARRDRIEVASKPAA
jgi:hypothetical protein